MRNHAQGTKKQIVEGGRERPPSEILGLSVAEDAYSRTRTERQPFRQHRHPIGARLDMNVADDRHIRRHHRRARSEHVVERTIKAKRRIVTELLERPVTQPPVAHPFTAHAVRNLFVQIHVVVEFRGSIVIQDLFLVAVCPLSGSLLFDTVLWCRFMPGFCNQTGKI